MCKQYLFNLYISRNKWSYGNKTIYTYQHTAEGKSYFYFNGFIGLIQGILCIWNDQSFLYLQILIEIDDLTFFMKKAKEGKCLQNDKILENHLIIVLYYKGRQDPLTQ